MRGRRLRLAVAEELLGLGDRHREHLADVLAAERVLEHRRVEPLALALLAGGGDAGHHPQVGVDDAGAVAVGAGALGVGAEQRRLDAVGLRERLADRVEQSGVGRRVAAPRAADRALVDRHHPVPAGHRAVDQRALARPGHAGHARPARRAGCRRRRPAGCWCRRRAPPARPTASRTDSFREARSSRWRPVIVSLARSPSTVPSKTTSPPRGAGAGAEVDDVVGDRDRLRLVLHDEHRVALVAQLQQQVVHPLDVVRVQADRRLVEDVGDVGERGAEVADHLGALRLAARQRARRPVEREVAQPDLDERVERVAAAPRAAAPPTARRGRAPTRRGR